MAKSDNGGNSKQRLRPWLEAQINGGLVPGLYWLDEDKTKFRISWKHSGKQDWCPKHGQIFMEWAKHTGKYRVGIDKLDWVTWKTRLRCAFNKAPDIEEVKEESNLDEPEPFRVYFLKPKTAGKKKSAADSLSESVSAIDVPSDAVLNLPTVCALIPTVVEDFSSGCSMTSVGKSLPQDLKNIDLSDLLGMTDDINLSGMNMSIDKNLSMMSVDSNNLLENKPPTMTEDDVVSPSFCRQMDLKIYYCGREVFGKTVKSDAGCHLNYGSGQPPIVDLPEWLMKVVYGIEKAEPVWMPPCLNLMDNEKQEKDCQLALEKGMERGVFLINHDDDIYAYRLTRCTIFYASETGTSGRAVKLNCDRDELTPSPYTRIFNFKDEFLPALSRYETGVGLKPSALVYLLIGANKPISEIDKNVLMYVTIATHKALDALAAVDSRICKTSATSALEELVDEFFLDKVNSMSMVDDFGFSSFVFDSGGDTPKDIVGDVQSGTSNQPFQPDEFQF